MAARCYLLVRFDTRQKLLPAIEGLDALKQVEGWDAVDGYYSLVLRVKDDCAAVSDHLKKLDGFSELTRCEITKNGGKNIPPPPGHSQSYVFAEVDKARHENVLKTLTERDDIISCHATRGGYDLVAVVTGEQFDDINRTVNNSIRLLDGVLRLKQDRIIYKDEM